MAGELDRVEGHDAAAVVVSGVSPAEAHLSVVKAERSSVGDGDTVGVAGQVLEHVFGAAEGRLGVDHPPLPAARPPIRLRQDPPLQTARQLQPPSRFGPLPIPSRYQHPGQQRVAHRTAEVRAQSILPSVQVRHPARGRSPTIRWDRQLPRTARRRALRLILRKTMATRMPTRHRASTDSRSAHATSCLESAPHHLQVGCSLLLHSASPRLTSLLSSPPSDFASTRQLTANSIQSLCFYRASDLLQIAVSALLRTDSVGAQEALAAEHCRYGTRDL
jgi:hypothetical protein